MNANHDASTLSLSLILRYEFGAADFSLSLSLSISISLTLVVFFYLSPRLIFLHSLVAAAFSSPARRLLAVQIRKIKTR